MDSIREAQNLSVYLCGRPCSDELAMRYSLAIGQQQIQLSEKDQKLWDLAMKNTFFLAAIDSGLALTNSKSQIRRKVFLMLAILEASVEFCDEFIPKGKSKLNVLFSLVWIGMKAVFFAIIGILIVKLI